MATRWVLDYILPLGGENADLSKNVYKKVAKGLALGKKWIWGPNKPNNEKIL